MASSEHMTPGARIRLAMHHRRIDQISLAKMVGISQQLVSLIINNRRNAAKHIKAIAEQLRCPEAWLISGDEQPEWFDEAMVQFKKRELLNLANLSNLVTPNLLYPQSALNNQETVGISFTIGDAFEAVSILAKMQESDMPQIEYVLIDKIKTKIIDGIGRDTFEQIKRIAVERQTEKVDKPKSRRRN